MLDLASTGTERADTKKRAARRTWASQPSTASLFKRVGVFGHLRWLALKCDDVLNTSGSGINAGSLLACCWLIASSLMVFCWLPAGSVLVACLRVACFCLIRACFSLAFFHASCLLFSPQDVSKMSSKWLQNSLKKASRGGPGAAPGGSREAPGGVRGRPGGVREAFRRDAGPRAGSGRLPEGVRGRFGSQVGPPLGPSRGSPGCLFQV